MYGPYINHNYITMDDNEIDLIQVLNVDFPFLYVRQLYDISSSSKIYYHHKR